jgi:hypothetical protein
VAAVAVLASDDLGEARASSAGVQLRHEVVQRGSRWEFRERHLATDAAPRSDIRPTGGAPRRALSQSIGMAGRERGKYGFVKLPSEAWHWSITGG